MFRCYYDILVNGRYITNPDNAPIINFDFNTNLKIGVAIFYFQKDKQNSVNMQGKFLFLWLYVFISNFLNMFMILMQQGFIKENIDNIYIC